MIAPRVPLSAILGVADAPEQPSYGSAGPMIPINAKPSDRRTPQGWLGHIASTLRNYATRDNLRVAGATLQQMSTGGNQLNELVQMMAEQRRQAAQDAWQNQLQQRQIGAWNTEDKRGIRLADWAQQQGPEAQIDPASAFQAHQQADALAHQPMTPYQQRTLDQDQRQFEETQATTRRGQDLDFTAAGMRGGGLARLRGPDASQMTRVQQAGEAARSLSNYADQFEAANQHTGTGPIGQYTQYFSPDQATMRQVSSLMRGLMRPIGSGATSDYEQRLYAQGAPDPGLPGPANQQRINNIRALAAINSARQFFYEDYADQNGTLRGAERAFQQSQEFIDLTGGNRRGAGNGRRDAPQADVRIDANGRIIR